MVMQVSQSRSGKAGGGNELLGRFGVALVSAAQAVVPDDAGLEFQQRQEHIGALFVHVGRCVPPQHGDRAVVGQNLLHLRHGDIADVIVHAAVLGFVPMSAGGRAARIVPVLRLRIVKSQFHAVFLARLGQRLEQIFAVGRGFDDVPVAGLRIEQRKAVVVLAGDDDVFHAGFFGELHPLVGIVFDRIELLGVLAIFGHGNLAAVHDPLADAADLLAVVGAGGHGIHAPVDEHAEPGLAPPGHALVALLLGFPVVIRRRSGFRSKTQACAKRSDC